MDLRKDECGRRVGERKRNEKAKRGVLRPYCLLSVMATQAKMDRLETTGKRVIRGGVTLVLSRAVLERAKIVKK